MMRAANPWKPVAATEVCGRRRCEIEERNRPGSRSEPGSDPRETTKEGRPYHSPARQDQARRTRARIAEAAGPLFAAQGYAKTSIRQIARASGVSVETIYAGGDKRSVFLQAFELTLRGNLDGTPLLELDPMEPALNTTDLDAFLRVVIDFVVDANARTVGLWAAFVEAATSDRALAQAYGEQMAAMRNQGRRVLDHAVDKGLCRRPSSPVHTVDAIWATLHPSQYELLVRQAGWSHTQYNDWLLTLVHHALSTL